MALLTANQTFDAATLRDKFDLFLALAEALPPMRTVNLVQAKLLP